jgi:hypothetical protein
VHRQVRSFAQAGRPKLATKGVIVPSRQEEFRFRQAECEERAKQSRDPEVRRQYEDLARQWREMADRAERPSW